MYAAFVLIFFLLLELGLSIFKGNVIFSFLSFDFIITDKSTLSVSSRTEDDILERGRGKRERKPKLHFDVSYYHQTSVPLCADHFPVASFV